MLFLGLTRLSWNGNASEYVSTLESTFPFRNTFFTMTKNCDAFKLRMALHREQTLDHFTSASAFASAPLLTLDASVCGSQSGLAFFFLTNITNLFPAFSI